MLLVFKYTLHLVLVTTLVLGDQETYRIKKPYDYLADSSPISSDETNSVFESKKLHPTSQVRAYEDSRINLENELNYQKDTIPYRIPVIALGSGAIRNTDDGALDSEQYIDRTKSDQINRFVDLSSTYEWGQKNIYNNEKLTRNNEILQGGYASSIESFQLNKKDGYVYEKPKIPFEEGPVQAQKPKIPTTTFRPPPPQKISSYQPSKQPALPTEQPSFQFPSLKPTQLTTYRPIFPSYQPPTQIPASQLPSIRPSQVVTRLPAATEPVTQFPSSPSSSETSFSSSQHTQKKPVPQLPSGYIYEKPKKPFPQSTSIISQIPTKIPTLPSVVPVKSPTTQLPLYRPTLGPQTPSLQTPAIFPKPSKTPVSQRPTQTPSISGYRPSFKPQLPESLEKPRVPTLYPGKPQIITPQPPSLKPVQNPQQPSFLPPARPTSAPKAPSIQQPAITYTPRPVISPEKPLVPTYNPPSKPSIITNFRPSPSFSPTTGYIYEKPKKPFVEIPSSLSLGPDYRPSQSQPSLFPIHHSPSQTPSSTAPNVPSYQIGDFSKPQHKPSIASQPTKTQFSQSPQYSKPSTLSSIPSYQRPSAPQLPGYKPTVQPPLSTPPFSFGKLPVEKSTRKPESVQFPASPNKPPSKPFYQQPSRPEFSPSQSPVLQSSKRPTFAPVFPNTGITVVSSTDKPALIPSIGRNQSATHTLQVQQRPLSQVPVASRPKEQTGYIYEKPKKQFIEVPKTPGYTTSALIPKPPKYSPPQGPAIQSTPSKLQTPSKTPQKTDVFASIPSNRPLQTSAIQAPTYRPTSQIPSSPSLLPASQQPSYKPSISPSLIPSLPIHQPIQTSEYRPTQKIPTYNPVQITSPGKPAYKPVSYGQLPSFEYQPRPQITDHPSPNVPALQQTVISSFRPSSIASTPSYQTPKIPTIRPPTNRPASQIPIYPSVPEPAKKQPSLTPKKPSLQKPSFISSVQFPTPQPPSYRPTQSSSYQPALSSKIPNISQQRPSSYSPIPSYQAPQIPALKPSFIQPTPVPQIPSYQFPSNQLPSKPIPQRPITPVPAVPTGVIQSGKPSNGYIYDKPKNPFIEVQTNKPFEFSKRPINKPFPTPPSQQSTYRPAPPIRKPIITSDTVKKPPALKPIFRPSVSNYQPSLKPPAKIPLKPYNKPPQIATPQTPSNRPPPEKQSPIFPPPSFNQPSVPQQPSLPGIYRPSQPQVPSSNGYVYEKPKKPIIENNSTFFNKPNIIPQQPDKQLTTSFVPQGPSYRPSTTTQFPSYQFPKVPPTQSPPIHSQKIPTFSSNSPVKKPINIDSQKPLSLPIPSQLPENIYPVRPKPQKLIPSEISTTNPPFFTSKPSLYPVVKLKPSQKPVYEAPGYIPPLTVSQIKPQTNVPSVSISYPLISTTKPSTYRPPVSVSTTAQSFIPSISTQKPPTYVPSTYKPFPNRPSSFKPFTSAPLTNKPYIASTSTTSRPVPVEPSSYKPFPPNNNILKPSGYKPFSSQSTSQKPYTYVQPSQKPFIYEPSSKPVSPVSIREPSSNSQISYKPTTIVTPTYKPISVQRITQKPLNEVLPSQKPSPSKPFTYGPFFQPSTSFTTKPFKNGPFEKPSSSTTSKELTYSPSTYKPFQPIASTPRPKFPAFSSITPSRDTFFTSTERPSTTTEDRHYLPPISDGYIYPKPNIAFDFK